MYREEFGVAIDYGIWQYQTCTNDVEANPSNIPEAGLGLFAKKLMKKGDVCDSYLYASIVIIH